MVEHFTRRATLAPASADPDARTVEAIWTTGAAVRRRDASGFYLERLSLDAADVDLSRLIGASVLDAHRQSAAPCAPPIPPHPLAFVAWDGRPRRATSGR